MDYAMEKRISQAKDLLDELQTDIEKYDEEIASKDKKIEELERQIDELIALDL
jgi:hypothetical protein